MKTLASLDPKTRAAAQDFADRIRRNHKVKRILLYGSRARGDHQPDSDVDLAVVLEGDRQRRIDAINSMSDPAWEIMMESGLFISPFPMWQDEWDDPTLVFNPWLIRNIKAEGIPL